MDKPAIIRATVYAMTLVIERLARAIAGDNSKQALREALTLEIGAGLIATAIATDMEMDASDIKRTRDKLLTEINTSKSKTGGQDIVSMIDNLENQRKNASNN
jgi:LDH2 family malate/lactate/ureidoglycolate dehydrogenase